MGGGTLSYILNGLGQTSGIVNQLSQYQQQFIVPYGTLGMPVPEKPKERKDISMLKEVKEDLKKFARDHKSLIYWTLGLIILDRIYFEGLFEKKLSEIAHRFVGIIEAKLDKIGAPNEKTST